MSALPKPIRTGRYTCTPVGKVNRDGACRWRLTGPKVPKASEDIRPLTPEQAAREVVFVLDELGIKVAPPRVLKHPPKIVPVDAPLPEWATIDPDAPEGRCCLVGCKRPARSRGLCSKDYRRARNGGIIDRIALPARTSAEVASLAGLARGAHLAAEAAGVVLEGPARRIARLEERLAEAEAEVARLRAENEALKAGRVAA